LIVQDVVSLANLYAVGFVGAIATNLGVNAANKTIAMTKNQRRLMWCTCALLLAIEITLFITKPNARRFAISIMTVGLILRMLVIEHRQRQWASKKITLQHASLFTDDTRSPLHEGAILCAVRTTGKTLHFAMEEAKQYHQSLYILFIREQKIITAEDRNRAWVDDEDASRIFAYAKNAAPECNMKFFYAVSASPVDTIVDMAKELHVSRVILGKPRHSLVLQILRGNLIQEVSETLSPEIDLVVIS
jgi:nucleotide-binding universal stress UspA family protein